MAKVGWNSHEDIAQKLLGCHKPFSIDYAARFGLAHVDREAAVQHADSVAVVSEATAAVAASLSATSPVPPKSAGGPHFEDHACRVCGATNLSILHGKYGYYFKCLNCNGNTPIKLTCGHAGHKERLRKEGTRFFRECGECRTSTLYFRNTTDSGSVGTRGQSTKENIE